MKRKMYLKKISNTSLIVLISCNLLAVEICSPSLLYAKGQTPAAELSSLLTIGEKQLQAVQQEKQMKLEEQQKKLIEEEKRLATEIQQVKVLYEQVMKEIRENSTGYNVGKINDMNLLGQILHGKKPRGRGADRRVKQQIQAIREGQKQVQAIKNSIADITAHYNQQITSLEQQQAQHQAQRKTLHNNQQELLQVENKAAQADGQAKQQLLAFYQQKIQRITNALHTMIQDLESSMAMISSEISTPANDHVKTMVSTLHAITNYKNMEQISSRLEVLLGHLPPEIKEDGSTDFLQPFQAKQHDLHTQMNTIVTQLASINQKHVEPLLQFFQQSRLEELDIEELAVLENQLLAMMRQQNADIVAEIQQQFKRADEREQEAYNQIEHSARDRVEQQRLDGKVLLTDLWASWSEEGEEREAAERRAEAKTKQLIQVLKNRQRLPYHSLWQAIQPEQGTTMPSTQKTENNQAKQRLYTTVEQASHYASMVNGLGQQLKMMMDGVEGEHARKIANEPTFAKLFTKLGNTLAESLQHPSQLVKSIYEGNKQAVQAVENSLQASLFGPGEAETNAHIRQQVDKQQVLRTMVLLAKLIEHIDSEITISDLVAQAQLLTTLERAAWTEEGRATYWSNLEAAAENVLQVKQAKENITGQRQALQHLFLPMVEMIEHNLFDSPGWQAQILDKLKYVQFTVLAIEPIGSFVPISPQDATTLVFKGMSKGAGIISRTATQLEMIKDSAVGAEETAVKQISEEIEEESAVEETEIQVCRPCGIGGRAKRSAVECCEMDPQPGTSTTSEPSELDDNIPAPPTEEEIAVMEGREQPPQPGTSDNTRTPSQFKPNGEGVRSISEQLDVNNISANDNNSLSKKPTQLSPWFPTEEEISQFPTEGSPLILNARERRKLIHVPFKEGNTVLGELSFSENYCEILISGLTEADASRLPIIYGLENANLLRTNSLTENHFFKYRNEAGAVLPVETMHISVHPNRFAPVIRRVGQKFTLQWDELQEMGIVTKTVIGKVLSLGDQPNSFVQIGVPLSTTIEEFRELPLNIFVRMDGEDQGTYKPIQYVYTDEIQQNNPVDVNESPQETAVVVGQKLSFSLPEGSIEGMVEHIDTVLRYPIVFIHVPVSPEHVQSKKQQLQAVFQEQCLDIPMEWKGQRINAPVVFRIGDEVIGGRIGNVDVEWEEVTHWRPVSLSAENAKQVVKSTIEGIQAHPERLGSTIEMLDLFPFDLQAKSLQKLIKAQVVPQQQLKKLHTKLEDIMVNTVLPNITKELVDTIVLNHAIYDYSPYQIGSSEEYIVKQAVELVKKSITELLQNDIATFGLSLHEKVRKEMDPVVMEVAREASYYYHEMKE
ncbi:hypothetical protein [Paenibacillus popilliae]|uniref:Dynactin complex subunit n=1 Tax=Paenibacillus popilliae ATCC 14706 TaxID=1212764 RepID=M9LFT4_PAEPP|nr:hypothetical protein [Paenibacillus popilliae]GAC41220.1 dynactin complex subunit [Paenibacillus popilliae ATCC 14706]